jgi:drug/metabolite transporter (DMT)-like permease
VSAVSRSREARRSAYIGVVCAIAGALAFSAKPVIIKLAYQYDVDAMTLLALRMLFALPLFLLMAWWAGSPPATLTRNDWLALLGLGFIGYYLGSFLDLAGLQYISASLGRLILYLYPTLVLLISALVLKQRILPRHLISLALSYGGILLVFRSEIALEGLTGAVLLGTLLVFGGAITYAIYLIAGAHMVQKLGSMRFTAYASISATVFVLGTFVGTHGVGELAVAREVYALTVLLAVVATVLPLWLMAEGLRRIGANQSSLLACIGPISTIGLAHVFLGEPITSVQIAGAALVLAGVVIITLRPRAVSAKAGAAAPR